MKAVKKLYAVELVVLYGGKKKNGIIGCFK
jgi:hypothetical protein